MTGEESFIWLVIVVIFDKNEGGGGRVSLGRNGEGKTTLSKIIADLESYDGELKIGHNVLIGYFAQLQAEELNPKQTVLETLDSVATGDMRTQLRSLLGAFLFNGDDVFKPVSVLSGGEKSRLSLAKLLLEPVNLLIMDEPTNHLDMRSIAVLKKAVAAFEGAVIVVSHDRDFLSGIMTRCIEFKDKKIKEYIGGIEEFLYKKNAQSVEETIAFKKDNSSKNISQNQESEKDRKRREAEERNKKYSLTKDVRKKLDSAVIEIDKLEKEKLSLEEQLNLPQILSDSVKLKKLRWQLEITTKQLEKNFTVWEKLTSELESVESQFTT